MLTSTAAQQLLVKYQSHFEKLKALIYTHSALDDAYVEEIMNSLKMIASDNVSHDLLLKNILAFWKLTHDNEERFEKIINTYIIEEASKTIFKQFLNEEALVRHVIMYTSSQMLTHSWNDTKLVLKFPSDKIRNEFLKAVAGEDNLTYKKSDFVVTVNSQEADTVLIYTEIYGRKSISEPYIKNITNNEHVKQVFTEIVDINVIHEEIIQNKQYFCYPLKHDSKLSNVATNAKKIYALANDKKNPTFFSRLSNDLNIKIASLTEQFEEYEKAEEVARASYHAGL